MDALADADVFLFEGFRLDLRGGDLLRRDEGGVFVRLPIGSRALEILEVLVRRSGDLVTRDEIMKVVWPKTVVENSNLPVQIAALRRLLDDGRSDGSCIQTVPGRGYRFVVPVARLDDAAHSASKTISPTGEHVRPRLSIVVLPFTNLGGGPEQQYFADGFTEDLTTDLSRIADMFVISRHTAFAYQNKRVDTKQIGRELGVRYVLEGSVRRSGSQVRVSAQLIAAETAAHLWAGRFDRNMSDLFALQDEVTTQIAVELDLELVSAATTRPTENPDALDYILRGRAVANKRPTRGLRAEAISMFERALALDPRSVEAQCLLAGQLAGRAMDGMADSAFADIVRAEGLATQALAASPHSARAHHTKGQVLRAQGQILCMHGRCEDAILEYETAS